jgi:hypothetical protein
MTGHESINAGERHAPYMWQRSRSNGHLNPISHKHRPSVLVSESSESASFLQAETSVNSTDKRCNNPAAGENKPKSIGVQGTSNPNRTLPPSGTYANALKNDKEDKIIPTKKTRSLRYSQKNSPVR